MNQPWKLVSAGFPTDCVIDVETGEQVGWITFVLAYGGYRATGNGGVLGMFSTSDEAAKAIWAAR